MKRETAAVQATHVQVPPGVNDNDDEDDIRRRNEDERPRDRDSEIDQELALAGWNTTQRAATRREPQRALAWCRAAATATAVTNAPAWGYAMFARGGWPPTTPGPITVATATLSVEQRAHRWVEETAGRFEEPDFRDLVEYDWVEKAGLPTAVVPSLIAVYGARAATESTPSTFALG